jgi:ribonucleoside-diphosphate reductase alpha chain
LLENFDLDIGPMNDPHSPLGKAFLGIHALYAMPSMRCMMTAGPALQKEPLCGFNCSYRAIDNPRAFSEIMYALMCGCGVGFSVERQFTGRLPMIPKRLKPTDEVIVVQDSRRGWAEAFQTLVDRLYAGNTPQWNVELVRPAGARLKTMGGYASGPAPLVDLFKFTIELFKQAQGDRLNSLQCHDLACKIGDIVVAGGVRRSALISLSNPSDLRMRDAKSGNWYQLTPWRSLANNSACYTERPSTGVFMEEWMALYKSKSGERGIVNREALITKTQGLGRRVHWDHFAGEEANDLIDFGTNPCAEIILRSAQTCNLSEIVARAGDDIKILQFKAGLASMLGTWQATLSKYGYMGPEWQENAEEERLLGVSITGIMDCHTLSDRHDSNFASYYKTMREYVIGTNEAWAKKLDIHRAAAHTCVKPSGTVSQLVNAASGVHDRFAPFYFRRIIMDNHDPMCEFLKDQGIPNEPSDYNPKTNTVFTFPIRSPGGHTKSAHPAIEQLEHWKVVNNVWADHSVSCTIEVDEHEWPEVGGWVYKNFDEISGISFIPKSDTVYSQMPFEACTEEQVATLEAAMPKNIDWNMLAQYEHQDTTKVAHELACAGGVCELVQ